MGYTKRKIKIHAKEHERKNNKIHAKEHERKKEKRKRKKDTPYFQNQRKGERSMTKEFK